MVYSPPSPAFSLSSHSLEVGHAHSPLCFLFLNMFSTDPILGAAFCGNVCTVSPGSTQERVTWSNPPPLHTNLCYYIIYMWQLDCSAIHHAETFVKDGFPSWSPSSILPRLRFPHSLCQPTQESTRTVYESPCIHSQSTAYVHAYISIFPHTLTHEYSPLNLHPQLHLVFWNGAFPHILIQRYTQRSGMKFVQNKLTE